MSALHGEMEWCHSRPIEGIQACLWPSLGRVEQNPEERHVSGSSCAVQGMLRCAIFRIDLGSDLYFVSLRLRLE